MRILLVAPSNTGLPELDIHSEMNTLTSRHEVRILAGDRITGDFLYQIAETWRGEAIHYVSHMGPAGVILAGGEVFDREDIASICRITEAPILFLNGCEAHELASYAGRHGAKYVFFGNVKIADIEGLRFAKRFYSALASPFYPNDIARAIEKADEGNGDFGWAIAPEVLRLAYTDRAPVHGAWSWRNWHLSDWRTWLMVVVTIAVIFLTIRAMT